ncbi:MAG: hypothetical protein AB7K09_18125 [Planctomycetota bacterium]
MKSFRFRRVVAGLTIAALMMSVAAGCGDNTPRAAPAPAGGTPATNTTTAPATPSKTGSGIALADKARWEAAKASAIQLANGIKTTVLNGSKPDGLVAGATADDFASLVGFSASQFNSNGFSASDYVLESIDASGRAFVIKVTSSTMPGTLTVNQSNKVTGP